jgi:hypothetical protein
VWALGPVWIIAQNTSWSFFSVSAIDAEKRKINVGLLNLYVDN